MVTTDRTCRNCGDRFDEIMLADLICLQDRHDTTILEHHYSVGLVHEFLCLGRDK